jgi:hypothetical protein
MLPPSPPERRAYEDDEQNAGENIQGHSIVLMEGRRDLPSIVCRTHEIA